MTIYTRTSRASLLGWEVTWSTIYMYFVVPLFSSLSQWFWDFPKIIFFINKLHWRHPVVNCDYNNLTTKHHKHSLSNPICKNNSHIWRGHADSDYNIHQTSSSPTTKVHSQSARSHKLNSIGRSANPPDSSALARELIGGLMCVSLGEYVVRAIAR